MSRKILALILIFSFVSRQSQAHIWGGCRDIFAHFFGRTTPLKEGRVHILFYTHGHTEIEVDDQSYFVCLAVAAKRKDSLDIHRKSALQGKSFPLITVEFLATEAEIESLKESLSRGGSPWHFCNSQSCAYINKNLDFTILPPFQLMPGATLAYLAAVKGLRLDHGRIGDIEVFAYRRSTLYGTLAVHTLLEAAFVGTLIYWIKEQVEALEALIR